MGCARRAGRSGVGPLSLAAGGNLPVRFGAEARQFSGEIDDFGPLEKEQKKAIRKGLKMMCRECQMGVAAALLALADAGLKPGTADPDRSGIVFGTDYMLSVPGGVFGRDRRSAGTRQGRFQFPRWGAEGLTKMPPLWLLKYLPNMPASHLAIYTDFRGPNNSLTMREAAANAAIGEAYADHPPRQRRADARRRHRHAAAPDEDGPRRGPGGSGRRATAIRRP